MHETFWNTEVFPNEIFWYCVTKSFRRRNLIPPFLMLKIFRFPKFCDTPKCSPTNNFGTARQKIFDGKYWYPPPLSLNFFANKNFLKQHRRVTPWKFSALWDIKISSEKRDKPPLIHKFFSIPENFRKTEGFFYKAFRSGLVRQKFSTKPWCPSPSYAWKFSIKEFFWTTKVFSNELFGYTETENRDTTPLIHKIFFFLPEIFWNSTEGFPYEIFRHCETKNFRRKILIPPPLLSIIFFSLPDFFWNTDQKGSTTKFFGTVRKKFWLKTVITPPPPVLSITFFDTTNFVKQRRVLLRSFLVLWDNKFPKQNRDIPLLGIKFFATQNFLKHSRVPRRNFSALWDENFSTEISYTLLHKVQKSVVELMFVRTLWKLISKQ